MNGMLGYMDTGRLPFDINDFGLASPKRNDKQHIHMLNTPSSKESESTIDDFFKSVMADTYTPAIPPQPVPPVAPSNYYGSAFQSQQQSSNYEQFNQYDGNTSNTQSNVFAGEPKIFVADVQSSFQYTPNSIEFISQTLQPPPPMPTPPSPPPPPPPSSQYQFSKTEYNPDSWEMDMSWSTQDGSFNQSMDAPHSPPHYERKGVNTNVIEYIEPDVNDSHLTGSRDVDHRQLILPNMNGLGSIGTKDHGRSVDVDHRNLISLTRSPKLGDKDSSNDRKVNAFNA